jgi:hypothetical protein
MRRALSFLFAFVAMIAIAPQAEAQLYNITRIRFDEVEAFETRLVSTSKFHRIKFNGHDGIYQGGQIYLPVGSSIPFGPATIFQRRITAANWVLHDQNGNPLGYGATYEDTTFYGSVIWQLVFEDGEIKSAPFWGPSDPWHYDRTETHEVWPSITPVWWPITVLQPPFVVPETYVLD